MKAEVAPIFKKGSKNLAVNYIPISQTRVSCKPFEHIITKHISNHLDGHNILSKFQHGFRYLHFCETQLMITIQDLMSHRDNNTQIDIAILDFSKAFNTVPHDSLLGKLQFYSIDVPILKWISVFLKNRDQCIVVDGAKSELVSVDSGIPQGTVLGTILFLLHINDLPDMVSLQVRLFADNCLLYHPITSIMDQVYLQEDLDSLVEWGNKWGMHFNAPKCNILRISRSHPLTRFYTLSGHILDEVNEAKYLGINISNELIWSTHVSVITQKGNCTLGFIRRNLNICPMKLKETAYIALTRSVLEYNVAAGDPYLKKDTDKLEKLQRKAAKFTTSNYDRTSSVTKMLSDHGWSKLADRRRELRLALLYKVVKGQVAVSADSLGLIKADNRTRSSNPHQFKTILTNSTQYKNSFVQRTIIDWNKRSCNTVSAESVAAFKSRIAKNPD